MLTEICQYLHNWFNRKPDGTDYQKWIGEITIQDGAVTGITLAEGQYFRILGSLFNDGVHSTGDTLTDETFTGEVWSLGVPPEVIQLAEEIEAWNAEYGAADSEAMSPFQSESFGPYSYSKKDSGSTTGGADATRWQGAFRDRLGVWKKL